MSAFSLLLNVLWIVFGGLEMAIAWFIAAIIMAITIVGLPWARAAFNIGVYTLLPFGQTAISRAEYFGTEDTGTGLLGFIGNLIWLVLAGWWLALGHLIIAILFAITLVGIPFAWAHLKLAGIALWPIGKIIVPIEDARLGYPPRSEIRQRCSISAFRKTIEPLGHAPTGFLFVSLFRDPILTSEAQTKTAAL